MAVPLIPFIVLFCHAIETCDPAHLENLAAVAETAHITADLPNMYRKQLQLFKLMHDVACRYVGSRTCNPPVHISGRIPNTPFEMLFTEAGIPMPGQVSVQADPQRSHDGTQHVNDMTFGNIPAIAHGNMTDDSMFTHSMELGNWFEQNQEIFMMLDNEFQ